MCKRVTFIWSTHIVPIHNLYKFKRMVTTQKSSLFTIINEDINLEYNNSVKSNRRSFTSLNFDISSKIFCAIYFLKCVTVAFEEILRNLRPKGLRLEEPGSNFMWTCSSLRWKLGSAGGPLFCVTLSDLSAAWLMRRALCSWIRSTKT